MSIPIHIMWTYKDGVTLKRNAYDEIYLSYSLNVIDLHVLQCIRKNSIPNRSSLREYRQGHDLNPVDPPTVQ